MEKLHILLDNGHGNNTPGKCSPDKSLLEYKYCREITAMIKDELDEKYECFETVILVPEDWDVTLKERVNRCNKICKDKGSQNCIFLSIHNNAAGNSSNWMSARGWSGWIYRNASEKSKLLANLLFDACAELKLKTRKPLPNQKYWDCGFYICKNTNCPAVLTENFFQDNKEDVDFLLSDEGKQAVADIHINAILKYYKEIFGEEPKMKPNTIAEQTMPCGGCNFI